MAVLLLAASNGLLAQTQVQPMPLDAVDPRLEIVRPLVAAMLAAQPGTAELIVTQYPVATATRDDVVAQVSSIVESYGGGRYRLAQFMQGRGDDIIVELNSVADNAPAAFGVRLDATNRIAAFIPVRFGVHGGSPAVQQATAGPQAAARQPTAPAPAIIDDARKKLMVDSLARVVERFHTAPDTGRMIADAVRRAEREGRYRALNTDAFTKSLTQDLRSINGDKHLGVTSQAPVAQPGAPNPAQARLVNYSFTRAEYLPGNVGYLKLTGVIYGSSEAHSAAAAALTYLGNADALIIDVRGVPGGSSGMVNFLFSHFVPAGTQEVRVVNRMNGTDNIRVALESVPGPRRTDIPLYILTDGKSGSAAEALPFALKNAGRATIVGESTAGAGRNNTFVDLGSGLWASVTFTRVSDPRTGREFEGIGVQPDIAVPSAQALDAAHAHALERLVRDRSN